MGTPQIRPATSADSAFLVEAIIAAEKSNSDKLGLATLFDLREEEVAALIVKMLDEEVDGCEFSTSSFLIAEVDGRPAAAVAGWVEGLADDMPSRLLKANLIAFTFPKAGLVALQSRAKAIAGIQIEREQGTFQVEYVYVRPEHRGKGLAASLILRHWELAMAANKELRRSQVQAFSNNITAIGAYSKLGFHIARIFRSDDPATADFLPHTEKVLMEKQLR